MSKKSSNIWTKSRAGRIQKNVLSERRLEARYGGPQREPLPRAAALRELLAARDKRVG